MADSLEDEAAERGAPNPELYDDVTGEYVGPATHEQCEMAARFKRRVTWVDADGRAYMRAGEGLQRVRVRHHPIPTAPDVEDDPRWDPAPRGQGQVQRFVGGAKDFVIGILILLVIAVGSLFVMWLTGEGIYHCDPNGTCR